MACIEPLGNGLEAPFAHSIIKHEECSLIVHQILLSLILNLLMRDLSLIYFEMAFTLIILVKHTIKVNP